MKYADDLVLLDKEETMLQNVIDKLIEKGRCYEMEMNVGNTKVMRISRQPSPMQIMIHQKQPGHVQYFSYLGSMIANDARYTLEIESKIFMGKAADFLHKKIGLKVKDETSKVLHSDQNFERCLNLDTLEGRSETPGEF